MNLKPRPIPARLKSLVSHVLQPGEKVLWWGQPSRLLYGWMPLFMLLWCLLVDGGLLYAAGIGSSLPSLPWEVLALGACMIVWLSIAPLTAVLAYHWSHAGRTLYLLTSSRAIHCRPTWWGQYVILETRPENLSVAFVARYGDPFTEVAQFRWLWHGNAIRDLIERTLLLRLVERLEYPDNAVRRKAIVTAAEYARNGKVPAAALVAALASDDCFVRSQAARALGSLRPVAASALPALRRAVFDDHLALSQAAIRSIDAIRRAASDLSADQSHGGFSETLRSGAFFRVS